MNHVTPRRTCRRLLLIKMSVMEIRSNVIDGFVNGFFEDNWLLWIILNDSISGSLITHPPTRVPAACRLEEIKNGAWSITLTKNKISFPCQWIYWTVFLENPAVQRSQGDELSTSSGG